jgi:hypothetical protein
MPSAISFSLAPGAKSKRTHLAFLGDLTGFFALGDGFVTIIPPLVGDDNGLEVDIQAPRLIRLAGVEWACFEGHNIENRPH